MNKRLLLYLALVLLATLLIYSNHFHNSFHFDDSHSVEGNTFIRNIKNIPLFFTDGSTSSVLPQNQSYRPVVTTSLAIDYWLGNGDIFYFHLSMFILFLCQGCLMLMLYNKVYAASDPKNATVYIALIAVAWYLLHPAIAETVNYVIARSDMLSTFGVLLAFVLYIYSPFCKRMYLYLLPVVIGALAKPPSVMFAPLLFSYVLFFEDGLSLYDVFRTENLKRVWQVLLKTLPSLIVCALLYLFISKLTPSTWVAGGSSPLLYLITQPFVILHYFTSLFVPTGLSADSDWGLLPGMWDIRFFIGTAFIVIMLWLAFYTSKRQLLRPISFGILWFFLALIPTSSIIPLAEVLNDHRLYFPYIGLVLSASWAIRLFVMQLVKYAKLNPAYIFTPLLLLPLFAYGTYKRNQVWRTEETLWYNVTIKSPLNGRGLMNYGLSQMEKGNYAAADVYFNRALVLLPQYSTLYVNLGVLKDATGDKATAETYYLKAIQYGPAYPASFYFYGRSLNTQGRYTEAATNLEKAVALSPGDISQRLLLMSVYENMGKWEALGTLARTTLAITPGNPDILAYQKAAETRKGKLELAAETADKTPTANKYLDLSLMYYQAGRYQQCIDAAAKAISLKPDLAEAYNNMGSAYNALKQFDKAIEPLNKAIALKPDLQLAKNNLAQAKAATAAKTEPSATANKTPEDYVNLSLSYYNQGQYQQCIDACEKALALRPTYDVAYNNICASYNKLGSYDKAIAAAQKGLKLNPANQLLKNNMTESYTLKRSVR